MDNPFDRPKDSMFDPGFGTNLPPLGSELDPFGEFTQEKRENANTSPTHAISGTHADFINANHSPVKFSQLFGFGPLDTFSLIFALAGSALVFLLGIASIELSRMGVTPETVWLPAAAITAILLRSKPANELPVFAGVLLALIAMCLYSGASSVETTAYSLANLVEIILVLALVRRNCSFAPDIINVRHLGQFLAYVGVVGPFVSAIIAAIPVLIAGQAVAGPAFAWFLSHSLGMVLLVPALVLTIDAARTKAHLSPGDFVERLSLVGGGLLVTFAVFAQQQYPLFFLIPPISLLVAFRAGGLGTALYTPALAVVATLMTMAGMGPIAAVGASGVEQTYLLQAFIAANFLTGLPVAAILSSRAKLTREMVEARAELAMLTKNLTDAVLHIDDNGVCTYASKSVQDVLGRSPDKIIGSPLMDQAGDETTHDKIADVLLRLRSGESDKERVTYQRSLDAEDGTPVFLEADAVIAKDPETDSRSGIVICARDVTERVELEMSLTQERRKAEEAVQAKSEFLANMSHEIRTPMNGVLGFAELMLQSELGEEQRRHTEMIVQSGRSMMLLLNDILDFSKIEAGQIVIDKSQVDLIGTLEECILLHRAVAEKKGLNLQFLPPEDPRLTGEGGDGTTQPMVVTDPLRFRQIVLNLIGNAVKFTDDGRVDLSCRIEEDMIRVCVKDTGIGISQDRIESIFSAFSQAETDTARRFGGTGLGLTISLQLADLLGGTIKVESEEGFGSTFSLLIPANIVEGEVRKRESGPGCGSGDVAEMSPDTLPMKAQILLVEDHDVNRMLATEMLERCGQSVAVACDGNEAIAMVMDSVLRNEPYDLVLMDIQMPGCDGYAATRAIRAEGITPDTIPILALTANAFPEDIEQARSAGMQAHLTKPIVFPDLARALQRWLPTRIIDESGEENPAAGPQLAYSQPSSETQSARPEGPPATSAPQPTPQTPTPKPRPDFEAQAPSKPPSGGSGEAPSFSPALAKMWNTRRSEAIEAVREALEGGLLGSSAKSVEDWVELARLVHKLAGTAGTFGEPELGEKARDFERTLRQEDEVENRETLAFELLHIADNPEDRRAVARN